MNQLISPKKYKLKCEKPLEPYLSSSLAVAEMIICVRVIVVVVALTVKPGFSCHLSVLRGRNEGLRTWCRFPGAGSEPRPLQTLVHDGGAEISGRISAPLWPARAPTATRCDVIVRDRLPELKGRKRR